MDTGEFERDLGPWIDGELPAERAARMQSVVDASPELARRAAFERRFLARVTKAMASDADAAVVAAMIARARGEEAPAGRLRRIPRAAWRAAAAVLVVAVTGMWWFCVPPFECPYMQALEAASHDSSATPGAEADALAKRFDLPAQIDGAVVAPPPAATTLDVHGRKLAGVRLEYVGADGATTLHVVACESRQLHPSIRRRVSSDGIREWWTRVHAGERTWAFQSPTTEVVYAVTGSAADEAAILAAAKALRASVR